MLSLPYAARLDRLILVAEQTRRRLHDVGDRDAVEQSADIKHVTERGRGSREVIRVPAVGVDVPLRVELLPLVPERVEIGVVQEEDGVYGAF